MIQLTHEEMEQFQTLLASIRAFRVFFNEDPDENVTPDAMRMVAATLRASADVLEAVADREAMR